MTFALRQRIPPWEAALRGETKVVDRRGHHLGHIHAFAVDPASHHVTHLTLEKGHVFGHRDVTIPATDINTMTEHSIVLRVDAVAVAAHADAHPA